MSEPLPRITFPREQPAGVVSDQAPGRISRPALWVVVGLVLLAFAWTVWPTPWRHFENDGWQYRQHRLTGEVQEFGTPGWGQEVSGSGDIEAQIDG